MRVLLPVMLAGLLLTAGCSKQKGTVKGEVLIDGKPLDKGTITFVATDGKTPQVTAEIKDGKYSAEVPPGAWTVKVNSPVVVGQRKAYEGDPKSPTRPIYDELVAERYNTRTELKTDVKP